MTTVRAHPRRGTRGVRRYFRPNVTRPHTTVRLYRKGIDRKRDEDLYADSVEAVMHLPSVVPFRGNNDPNTIYFFDVAEPSTLDTLNHEELHHILLHQEGRATTRSLDRYLARNMRYQMTGELTGGI